MKKRIFSGVVILIVLSLCLGAWGQPKRPENVKLNMIGFVAGTPLQADSEAMGMALMREYPDWKVTVQASRKGPAGVWQVREKKTVDIFIQLSPWKLEKVVYPPQYKHLDFEKDMSYQALAPHSVRPIHFLVLEETGLTSIKDMITKKFPARVAYIGLGHDILFKKIIEYYGVTWADMEAWGSKYVIDSPTMPTGADTMKQKGYNVSVAWSEAPHPLLISIHETAGLRMLPLEEGCQDLLRAQLGFTKTVVPAATYKFLKGNCPTVRNEASICAVTGKISDDMAYYICKGLWNQKKFIAAESRSLAETLVVENVAAWNQALADQGLPIHPGALKYYREQGWIK